MIEQPGLSLEDRKNAGPLRLLSEPHSDQAKALVDGIMSDVVLPTWPAGKQQRPASLEKHRVALGALLGGLLHLETEGKAGGHGTAPRDFPESQLGFGRSIFLQQRDALVTAGLLAYEPGWQRLHNFTNYETGAPVVASGGGMRARFRLTAKALERVQAAGVTLARWEDHWRPRKPRADRSPTPPALIELRGSKQARRAGKAPKLLVDFTDTRVAAWLADLQAHNAFLAQQEVGGISFVGLRRVFTGGDVPGFDWQCHGRFYSLPTGEPYEQLNGEERRRRVTLSGERVGEADLRASQLVLLYGLLQAPFDATQDPYTIGDLDRELVKAWVAQALGRGDVEATRWSEPARAYFATACPDKNLTKTHPLAVYRDQILVQHPVLRRLGQPDAPTILELQFHESEILRAAMASLREKGIASLPVHDSLLVPVSNLQEASNALVKAFADRMEQVTGHPSQVKPSVRLKGPEGDPEKMSSLNTHSG